MKIVDTPFPKTLHHTTNKFYSYHFRKKGKIKHSYMWWFKSVKVGKTSTVELPCNLHFLFTFGGKGKRAYDSSNCAAMAKMIEDCLVIKGAFKDDSIKYIKSVTYESKKGISNHLTVTIL